MHSPTDDLDKYGGDGSFDVFRKYLFRESKEKVKFSKTAGLCFMGFIRCFEARKDTESALR